MLVRAAGMEPSTDTVPVDGSNASTRGSSRGSARVRRLLDMSGEKFSFDIRCPGKSGFDSTR